MQPASSPSASPRRGRPRSFDAVAVTDKALEVFWKLGYDETSVDDLVAATGLSVSSVYAAYGSKHRLFEASLARYELLMADALDGLVNGARGLDDIVRFVGVVRSGLRADARPAGCLMVNTMVELACREPAIAALTARYRERIRDSLKVAFARAARAGEITARSGPPRAALVQAALFGALVTARAGGTAEAEQMLRGLSAELRRWRC